MWLIVDRMGVSYEKFCPVSFVQHRIGPLYNRHIIRPQTRRRRTSGNQHVTTRYVFFLPPELRVRPLRLDLRPRSSELRTFPANHHLRQRHEECPSFSGARERSHAELSLQPRQRSFRMTRDIRKTAGSSAVVSNENRWSRLLPAPIFSPNFQPLRLRKLFPRTQC